MIRTIAAVLGASSLPLALAYAADKKADIPQLESSAVGWSKVADDFQPHTLGPGPVTYEKDHPYVPNNDKGRQVTFRFADLTNPILKPWAIEKMREQNELAAAGKRAYEARASCRPGGVPGFLVMGRVNPVPYRGAAPALTDLLGGQVHVAFPDIASSIEYIRIAKLRALAVTTAARSQELPDIPTVGDFLPGYEASSWWGVGAPKGTPAEIIEKLNKEINAVLADPKMKGRLAELGGTALPGSPADFGKLIADETEKWGKVIRAAGIKAE